MLRGNKTRYTGRHRKMDTVWETLIYVLSGLASIGKSTIAQRVGNLHCLGASFFFSRDENDRKNAEKFLTTIAFQLCDYAEDFAQAIRATLQAKRGFAATSKEPLEQLNALVLQPLKSIKSRSRTIVIVVDALDEWGEEDGRIILTALDRLVQEVSLFIKVVLTTPLDCTCSTFSKV
jgi:hypothetical protein